MPLYSGGGNGGNGGVTNNTPQCVDVNSNCNLVNAMTNRPIAGLYGIG